MKALPTIYKGITYRSRLEARWAVLFDALGVAAEYEPEGYDLSCGNYLPDFLIRSWRLFVEIKGKSPNRVERLRCQHLASETGMNVLLLSGPLQLMRGELFAPGNIKRIDEVETFDAGLCLCRRCGVPKISYSTLDECGTGDIPLTACLSEIGCQDRVTPRLFGLEEAIAVALTERFGIYPVAAE